MLFTGGVSLASKRRTQVQREADLVIISELYLKGKSTRAIAGHLGLSQSQIMYDIKDILARWEEKAIRNIDALKNQELARINMLEREYWEGWERSQADKVVTSKATKRKAAELGDGRDDDGEPTEIVDPGSIEVTDTEQITGNVGNPAFLAGVQWCISERCKLLGIYAPTKSEQITRNIDFDKLTVAQLLRIEQGEDPIAVILDGYTQEAEEEEEKENLNPTPS